MHYYCTVVSKAYIHKGIMLYQSLKAHDESFKLYFICMSTEVQSILEQLVTENAEFITMEAIEKQDFALASVKETRNEKEYAWTSKASILLYMFKNYPALDHILWLDSDIVFYSSPEPVFAELNTCHILLTKEGFKGRNKRLSARYGTYNTGLMGFRKSVISLDCLEYFRNRCIDWCYDKVIPGKWSDQMYVNDWTVRFKKVRVSNNPGINATAWNIQESDVKRYNNDLYINDHKLVFYHYSGFRILGENKFDLCCYINLPPTVVKLLYNDYVKKYQDAIRLVDAYDASFNPYKGPNTNYSKNYYVVNEE